jgi:hypothetical protein
VKAVMIILSAVTVALIALEIFFVCYLGCLLKRIDVTYDTTPLGHNYGIQQTINGKELQGE